MRFQTRLTPELIERYTRSGHWGSQTFCDILERRADQEMVGFLAGTVATYKLPEQVEIFDEFPFTPTGKIQRHQLTRQVLARRGNAGATRTGSGP